MAACKNSANSNGGVSRTRRGVFILNTYRSTPYLERRADGAPPPVLTETGCTSSGHLGGRRGQEQVFALNQEFSNWYVPLECFESLILFLSLSGSALRALHLFMTFINLLIFFCFFNLPRGTQWMRTVYQPNFSFSVWAFCGVGPHKNGSQNFSNFGKKFYVQKIENFFFRFWVKKLCGSM